MLQEPKTIENIFVVGCGKERLFGIQPKLVNWLSEQGGVSGLSDQSSRLAYRSES